MPAIVPDDIDETAQLYAAGRATAQAMFAQVEHLFRGRRMAIELGCGPGHVLLGLAEHFEKLRGVDADQSNLAKMESRAAQQGLDHVRGFTPEGRWDEPTGVADFAFSSGLFQFIDPGMEIANLIQRTSVALRQNGIALFQFDTRPPTYRYRLGRHVPDPLLSTPHRRGIRSVRRTPAWVWDRLRGADLEVFGEWGHWTTETWFVARRR
jgi:cyclopropane fatty-acyl-phospholipid synthase-like methyltransferase